MNQIKLIPTSPQKYEVYFEKINKKTFNISFRYIGTQKKVMSKNPDFKEIKENYKNKIIFGKILYIRNLSKTQVLTIDKTLQNVK